MTIKFDLQNQYLHIQGLSDKRPQLFVDETKNVPLDDILLCEGAWKAALPLHVFDGRQHSIRVNSGKKNATFFHKSTYSGELCFEGGIVSGWLTDKSRPGAELEIDIDIDGATYLTITTVRKDILSDLTAKPETPQRIFQFEMPTVDSAVVHRLDIRIRGTDYLPFGRYLIGIGPAILNNREPRLDSVTSDALDAFISSRLLYEARALESPLNVPAQWRFCLPGHRDFHPNGVDIIVPVYQGREETLACLDSLIKASCKTSYNLIVINDASPDKDLTNALKRHAARHGYRLLTNENNLGFVATVNRGMMLSAENDVVLVNADTVVADGWLDKLRTAAYSAPRIATSTPLSNNATICSLPSLEGMDGVPYERDLAGVNALCTEVNAGVTVDIPTAHGFCMYIRRAALQEVGLFDAERFGRGYGEENDFSLRASAHGWRHVAACDVFVYHKGGVSFEDKEALVAANLERLIEIFPDYRTRIHDFINRDPMQAIRNRLQKALWRDTSCVVFISLATGGGVDTNIRFLARKLTQEGRRVLIARREKTGFSLSEWDKPSRLLYRGSKARQNLCADISLLNPHFVHVHHLIDLEDGFDGYLLKSGIPYYVTLHDYFYICPRVTLLDDDNAYCQLPDAHGCNTCLLRGGAHRDINASYNAIWPDITLWREKWRTLLVGARQVFAPSRACERLYARIFPELDIHIRPHLGPDMARVAIKTCASSPEVRIALLGGLGAHKGYAQIVSLLRWAEKRAPDLRFCLIGYSDHIDLIRSFSNLEDYGPYSSETLELKIKEARCQTALFLSPWPETYVYTLTEAIQHGLNPVALDIGALGERLRTLQLGELVYRADDYAEIIAALRRASLTHPIPGSYTEGEYKSLLTDYYQAAERKLNPETCILLKEAQGLYDDGWAQQEVGLDFIAFKAMNRLRFDIHVPPALPAQQVEIFVNDESLGRVSLKPGDGASRLDVVIKPVYGLVSTRLRFSHVSAMPSPDERQTSVRLGAAALTADAKMTSGIYNAQPIQVRSSPDFGGDQITNDNRSTVQPDSRDVVTYLLTQQRPSLAATAKGLAKDVLWSARVGRRQGVRRAAQAFISMRALRRSAFDERFYRMQLAGAERRFMDPVNHYVVFGAQQGFDPAPGFSTQFYLEAHDDLSDSGVNPFFHYIRHGSRENRRSEVSRRLSLLLEAPRNEVAPKANWPKQTKGGDVTLSIHEIRPDDIVLDTAYLGKRFMESYALTGPAPEWSQAVDAINQAAPLEINEAPDISIIVPVYGQLAYTLNCLHGIFSSQAQHSYEVLVGDDASPDETAHWLSKVSNVRFVHHQNNAGFIANCNRTAEHAKGRFLVFLNNDTRPCEGWLDQLISTFSAFPKAGLIGAKLFYPDGSLQEAGGIVWRDGSAWNYGRNDDPNRPEYTYARAVDYVSGAALMIRRETWDQMGGFDAHYSPAYYEDTDLAFRIRQAGLQVVMQPASKVVHYEGKTSGVNPEQGVKAYQRINQQKFFTRWREQLNRHRKNGDQPDLERDRSISRRVLILDACNPTPDKDAGSKATCDLIRYYQNLGYQVHFAPEDNFLYEPDSVSVLQKQGVVCHFGPYAPDLKTVLARYGRSYTAVHFIRPNVAYRNLDIVSRMSPQARLLYLNADLHFLRMQRQAIIENRPELLEEADRMKAREFKVTERVDITFVHSSYELEILKDEIPNADIRVLPLIETPRLSPAPFDDRQDIIFLGGFSHHPNVDAALWLVDEIWPKLALRLANARLLLVGAEPTETLLTRANERIIIPGQVADLAPWFDRSRVFAAALRYGAGVKGKVLASMANGVPVVATPIAAEGLSLKDDDTVFMASDAEAIVETIIRIFEMDEAEWSEYSAAARSYIARQHSATAATAILKAALQSRS